MKKIIGIMLAVVMLVTVLSVSALAVVNAPLKAAEATKGYDASAFGTDGGTVIFDDVTPLMPFDGGTVKANGTTIDYSKNEFDINLSIAGIGFAGIDAFLTFNPEIARPVYLYGVPVYDVKGGSGRNTYALSTKLADCTKEDYEEDYLEPFTGYIPAADTITVTDILENTAEEYHDGHLRHMFAHVKGALIPAEKPDEELLISYYEVYRWPFEIVAEDNNWYRTRIQTGIIEMTDDQLTKLYPTIVGDTIYYVNENYHGPKIDIVGANKADEGALRFGSVYFRETAHDTDTAVAETGVILYPTRFLDDATLTFATEGAITIPATGYYTMDAKEVVYTGILTGLEGYEDMYITARTYVKYNDGENDIVVYSDPIARSLDWVGDNTDMK